MKNSISRRYQLTALAILSTVVINTPAFAKHGQQPTNLVITDAYVAANGNLITGDFVGTPTEPAIVVATTKPIIILNSTFESTGDFIFGKGNNDITVLNCTAVANNPNIRGHQKGIFLRLYNPANVAMRNNVIQGVRIGLYIKGYSGNFTHNQTFRIIGNNFLNLDARPSDGKGGFAETGQYNGQAVHLGEANAVPDIEIAWNQVINQPYASATGAIFEFSESGGTPASPTLVHDNYLQGAYPAFPGKDLYGFGGILVGGLPTDNVATTASFINIYNNQVVSTANYGIAIRAGHDISMTNNTVVSSGYTAAGGVFFPMSSSYGEAYGAYNSNDRHLPATVFFNNNIGTNTLGLVRTSGSIPPGSGSPAPIRADWSLPGQGDNAEGNMDFQPNVATSPTPADEANQLVLFQAKFKEYAMLK